MALAVLAPQCYSSGLEVDVLPLHTEGLSATHAGHRQQVPEGMEAVVTGRIKEGPQLNGPKSSSISHVRPAVILDSSEQALLAVGEGQGVAVHAGDDRSRNLSRSYATPDGADMLAEQAADTTILIDLGLALKRIEAHGLVGAVVADDVAQPAADTLVWVHFGNHMPGLGMLARIDDES